ncbi:MAG: amidohydrolase family protein [Rhodospirillales bacterium]|nr:amidohydrolase family protein [Rhodospirillales bacterium]
MLAAVYIGFVGLLGLTATAIARASEERPIAFVNATVIDGTGRPPIEDATVIIEARRIAAVGPSREIVVPTDACVIDTAGRWIIPGLIDAHVHFFQSGGLYTRPDIIDLRRIRPYEEEILEVRARLEQTLMRYLASGVTTVLDVGGPLWTLEVRDLARRHEAAPRVAATGPLLATYAPEELMGLDDPPMIPIATAQQARAATSRLLAHKPDLIKIWFVFPGADISNEIAWVRAAIEEAHAASVRVVVHATQRRIARAIVESGADVLAHSVDDEILDDALLDRMAAGGVVYVTTLVVQEGYREVFGGYVQLTGIERALGDPRAIDSFDDVDDLPEILRPAWVLARASSERAVDPVPAANLRQVATRGITIAAGSDAGNIGTLHGPALHRELQLMVQAGLTPMQTLVAATRGGAAALGRSDEIGTVEAGKLADLVVLNADPLIDIANTQRIHLVVRDGAMFDPAGLARRLADGAH